MIKTYGKRGVCRSACMEFPSASMRLQRYNLKANPNHWDAKFCKAHHATFKTPGQASGSRGMFADWRSPAPPGAKEHVANLCQNCCRRLSQHGVGEVLILLRHCWPDAFFCVCLGSGSFGHDWASHCSVLFWSLDALFVFGLPPFAPLDS